MRAAGVLAIGAVFSIVQRFKSRAGYAAEVYVPQWHLHHTITLDFGVPTEVYAIWSAELAGVTPTTATFRLGACPPSPTQSPNPDPRLKLPRRWTLPRVQ